MNKFHIVMVAVIFLSGCASNQYAIQFDSNPQGAMLVCDGKNWGYTPTTLYLPKEKTKDQSELNLSGCTATWVSGAKNRYGTVPLNQYPDSVRITAPRPNAPNLEADMNFALKVQQFKYQQAQDAAAANAQAWKDLNHAIKDATPKSTYTNCYGTYGGVNCTSTSY
ncbi:hypothetical protein [Nitrosomonas eutropha]|uniref:hypothetical protein n=1 Tax=Nitrosomonas eutropha TaxID=916 RepID=UPI0008CA28E5|nr:hypothetical protein [Nitrosomonas eutropha]SEI42845.1 hypothetical protein SAMN05216318_102124 [Nitrosomonas eutropha]